MEAHACNFVFNALWNGKPVQLFQERCRVVMTRCHENESCSKVLNFLERLGDRIGCAHEEILTVIKPREDVGGNKSLGCIFSKKSVDWTNRFELDISGLTDLYDVFLFWTRMNQRFLAESEKTMLWQPRVIESGRKWRRASMKKRRRKEELLFCRRWVWFGFLSSMLWCHLCMHRVLWWGCLFHWEGRISGAACHLRKVDGLQNGLQWCQREVWCTGRRERASAPSPEAHYTWALIVARMSYLLKWTDTCLRDMTRTIWVQ